MQFMLPKILAGISYSSGGSLWLKAPRVNMLTVHFFTKQIKNKSTLHAILDTRLSVRPFVFPMFVNPCVTLISPPLESKTSI